MGNAKRKQPVPWWLFPFLRYRRIWLASEKSCCAYLHSSCEVLENVCWNI